MKTQSPQCVECFVALAEPDAKTHFSLVFTTSINIYNICIKI